MLCNICGKNPATVHLTEIVDDQMNELHLCEECARQKSSQMEQQFGLSDLLAGMADFEKPSSEKETAEVVKCPNCNMTYAEFKKIGRLGCSECYNSFKKYLGPLLKKIHGSNTHFGKSPTGGIAKAPKKKADLEELRNKLQQAVAMEAFEDAARIRDEIKEFERKQEEDKQK
jgi:protein arginine kinase activator